MLGLASKQLDEIWKFCFIALMQDADAIERMKSKFRALGPLLDERLRRQWAAAEAIAYGWGGIQAVSQATGLSHNTIRKGQRELAARRKKPHASLPQRLRREGGGRKRKTVSDPELWAALEGLVDPMTRGDPESPLRWTCKSTTQLAAELTRKGIPSARARWAVAESCRVQPAKQSQDERRRLASGSQRSVRAHQRHGANGFSDAASR